MEIATQTAVIAGAVSLVVAGLSNFGAEAYKRHLDKVSIAAALAGELAAYLENSFARRAYWLQALEITRRGEAISVAKVESSGAVVYQAYVSRLGSLGFELAEDVTHIYTNLEIFHTFIDSLVDIERADMQFSMLERAVECIQIAKDQGDKLLPRLRAIASREFMAV